MRALIAAALFSFSLLTLKAGAHDAVPESAVSIALDRDVAAGILTTELATVYRALAVVAPDSLPVQYRFPIAGISKCPTEALVAASQVINSNPDEYGQFARQLLARPQTAFYIESPLGYFRIHFDTTGVDKVNTTDFNANNIPDFVERAANLADSVWLDEVVTMGHLPPPSDGLLGGNGQYDIYFQQVPYYGYTSPETAGPQPWNDYSSHIVVNSTFGPSFPPNNDPEGDIIGALKVTIAHEFYHAVQFGYDATEFSFFMEQSSTWIEDVVYPVVNDNYNYLPVFYSDPQIGLQAGGDHRYSAFIWPKFLEERFGVSVIREMWSKCRFDNAIGAWGEVVDSAGSALDKEFTRFTVWNYFTGDRDIGQHFASGADYPQVEMMTYHYTLPDSGNFSSAPPEPYGSNYIVVENLNGYEGMLVFDFAGLSATTWGVGVIWDFGGGQYKDTIVVPMPVGSGKISIPKFQDVLRVIFVPGVAAHFGTAFNYTYHLYWRVAGDINGDNNVSIADAVFMINWIFAYQPGPNPISAGDVNCDGSSSIADAVHIINFIFGGGSPPCPY